MNAQKVAVLDLGTNTFNLLLAKVTAEAYYIYYNEKIPVKIGQGGISQGIISEAAKARALAALEDYKQKIDREEISKIYGYATSAFRNASNGSALRDEIERRTQLPIRIITGETEAEYIYYGVNHALDIGRSNALIMDIGGGSVEFIIANREKIAWKGSFEIGAQRLLDLFHNADPIPESEVEKLNRYFKEMLAPLAEAVAQHSLSTLIGSSGTFDTLSDVYCERIGKKIHTDQTEFPLDIQEYFKIHGELLVLNREQRMQMPGMIEMRVDMIVVASCLLHYVIQTYGIKHLRVSAHSLKEGMLRGIQQDLFHQNKLTALK